MRSIKSECLDQMIFRGQDSLDRGIAEYVAHYHGERSDQGFGNELISRAEPQAEGAVQARERLGGGSSITIGRPREVGPALDRVSGHYELGAMDPGVR